MIQGAINQLLTYGAAAKKASDIAQAKEVRAAEKAQREEQRVANAAAKEQAAKDRAMQRMREKVQAKWDQNKEYQEFKQSLGKNVPEVLSRLAYEKKQNAPKVSLGGKEVDFFSLGQGARAAIEREMNKGKK